MTDTERNNKPEEMSSYQTRVNDDYNVIRIRLDPSDIYERIETFLRGYKYVQEETDEGIYNKKIIFSKPKANDEGVGSILNWISGTLNAQIVQGNFPIDKHGFSEKYEDYIYEYNLALINMVFVSSVDWSIRDEDLEPIVDFIMAMIIPFMSRLLGNEERKSYSESIKTNETIQTKQKGIGGIFRR